MVLYNASHYYMLGITLSRAEKSEGWNLQGVESLINWICLFLLRFTLKCASLMRPLSRALLL